MADFTIKTAVWLHGQPWKVGQEESLQRRGFTDIQKAEQVRGGAIVLKPTVPSSEEPTVEPAGPTHEGVDVFEDMTVAELRDFAQDEDIDLTGVTRKANIIERIKAS